MVVFSQGGFPQEQYDFTVQVYYNNVHEVLMNKLIKDKKSIEQEERDAAYLTQYLNQIKQAVLSNNKNCFIAPVFDNLKKARVFNYLGMMGYQAGAKFEEDLSRVIIEVMNYLEGNKMTPELMSKELGITNIGSQRATFNSSQEMVFSKEMLAAYLQKDLSDIVSSDINGVFNVIERDGKTLGYELAARDGKIDVAARKGAKIVMQEGPELTHLYQLLENASFTAKNYQLETILKNNGIKLGNTKQLRYFTAGLTFYNPDIAPSSVETLFFASINKAAHYQEEIMKHMDDIHMIYELAGIGLRYDGMGRDIGFAKYLIVNTRHSTAGATTGSERYAAQFGDIGVYSVRGLIKDLFEGHGRIEKTNKGVVFSY